MTEEKILTEEKTASETKQAESAASFDLSLEAMLKAGAHFGHKKAHWNPKMSKFIFGSRNGVHVIDLEKSVDCFQRALDFVEETIKNGGSFLIVGTKKQAKDLVRATADKVEMPYVNERWLGGTFTNFGAIKSRVKFLMETEEALEKKKFFKITKLEKHKLEKKLEKIDLRMGGLRRMNELPKAVLILDVKKDLLAAQEAQKMGIKVVGVIDTNSDPNVVDYPIPANDDAISSLRYILGVFLKKVLQTKAGNKNQE